MNAQSYARPVSPPVHSCPRRGWLTWLALLVTGTAPLAASDFEPSFPDDLVKTLDGFAAQGTDVTGENPVPSPVPEPVVGIAAAARTQSALWEEAVQGRETTFDLQRQLHAPQPRRLFRERPWIVDGPSVPEPMLFDMVRPMNARKGELEMNVLGMVPLHARRAELDWAPEIEYAIADGVAVEFEFPFVDNHLESLKFAVQYTFDVGLNNRLIHGYHGIYEYVFDGQLSELTSLYLVGLQLNDIWSVVGMFGFRSTIESEARSHFTELIQNVSFFANVTETVIVGVETNMSHHLAGPSTLLIMPQLHWDMTEHLNLQFGFGLQAASDHAVALHAFRVVWEF